MVSFFCAIITLLASVLVSPVLAADTFVAIDHYAPRFRSGSVFIPLDGKPRRFDFGGEALFVNSDVGSSDIATINYWDVNSRSARVVNSRQIQPDGIPGRVFKQSGYTSIGYVPGDGIVEGALRCQINSYPIPERQEFLWHLVVRFASQDPDVPWEPLPRGVAPATVWQLKPVGSPPSLVMVVDTDPSDRNLLMLHFDHRTSSTSRPTRLGQIGGLRRAQDIDIRMESFLDERGIDQGLGYIRVWVDETLVVDRWGPTLISDAQSPPAWSIGIYLYTNKSPLPVSRFAHWKEARMMSK